MGHSCGIEPHSDAKSDPAYRRVLWIVLWANLLMFIFEMVVSHKMHSTALMADAADFFADAASYAVSLLVLGHSLRLRAWAALFKAGSMIAFGLYVLYSAWVRIAAGEVPDAQWMGGTALLALLVNIGCSVLLYRFRGGDSNRESVWLCSRNDAISNAAIIVAAGLVHYSGTLWPDAVVALMIAALSMTSAVHIIRSARRELASSAAHNTHSH